MTADDDDAVVLLWYDVCLGLSGIVTTLTAARDFPHRKISNEKGQSGTLEKRAIVTQAEMIEHSFYQFLNLWQALYLHWMSLSSSSRSRESTRIQRWLALCVVTAPWLVRSGFPVHSFSQNWKRQTLQNRNTTTMILYRVKKTQYLLYKHVILHGINLTMALSPMMLDKHWHVFWVTLNTAYVMEFFLQTLVKRRVLPQHHMLVLNGWLMLVSTGSVVPLLLQSRVRLDLSLLSLLGNFVARGNDWRNTMILATMAMLWMDTT